MPIRLFQAHPVSKLIHGRESEARLQMTTIACASFNAASIVFNHRAPGVRSRTSLLTCLSHSRAIWARARGVTRAVATRRSGKRQSEDLPPSIMLGFLASCCCLVLAQHKPKEGWQRPPLLQHRGESASPCGQDGTANRVVSGRDQ